MSVQARVNNRLSNEEYDAALISELTDLVTGRLCLRLGAERLPMSFESIAADAVVKAYRRYYFEGISSETVSGNAALTTHFVDDILAEYADEIEAYKAVHGGTGVVRFL